MAVCRHLKFPLRAGLLALIQCGALTYAANATAHAPPYGAGVVFDPVDPTRIIVNTNRGLIVTRDDGATWSFLCADALGYATQQPPAYVLAHSGAVVLATDVGLVETSPDLCSVSVREDVDPTVRSHWISSTTGSAPQIVATAGELSSGSAVYVQGGGPGDWTKQTDLDNVLLQRVVASPTDPTVIYGSGVRSDAARLFGRSTDGGVTWDLDSFPLLDHDIGIFAVGSSPAAPDRVFALVTTEGSATPDRMLLSTDGGATFNVVVELLGITSFAISEDGETVWVGSLEGVWRSKDAGEAFSQVGSITGVTCLATRAGELWICGRPTPLSLAVLKSKDGGESAETALAFPDVAGPIDCPQDSAVAQTCASLWTDWQIEMELAAGTSAASSTGSGCAVGHAARGATTTSAPRALLWFALLALFWLRGVPPARQPLSGR